MKTFLNIGARLRIAALALFASVAALSTAIVSGPAPLLVGTAAGLAIATPAEAGLSFVTSLRQARCQAIVTAAGSSAVAEMRTASKPTTTPGAGTLPTATGTLLATVTFGSTIGTCTAGVLDFDEAGITQNSASHVSGTPGHIRMKTSGGVAFADIDVCGSAPCWTFTGTVTTGQNVTGSSLIFTEGNS